MHSRHSHFAIAIGVVCAGLTPSLVDAQREPQRCIGADAPAPRIAMVGPEEPGDRLLLTGRVLDAAGEPQTGIHVRIFHTDAAGYYSERSMDESNPRLCGVARTDSDGRYTFETILPARYATGGGGAPHVHYLVWGDGLRRQTFLLQLPDPAPREAGSTEAAAAGDRSARRRPLARDADGALHAVRDLIVR